MAGNPGNGTNEKAQSTSRRTFMRLVGAGAAATAVGTASTGGAVGTENTVDLGTEGLGNGDLIDPYLEEYFTDGNEVRIPAGEYDYTGDGLGGEKGNCALVGSADGVTFNRPEDPEVEVRPTIMATDGTVRIENITIRGKRGEAQSRWRVGAEEGATMEVFNVNVPDGTIDGSDSTGLYAGTDHAGTLHCKACYFEQLGNVAMYVSDAYTGGDGKVVVEDCVFRNSNSSMVRFAPTDSVVRGCYFEGTEEPPSDHTGGTTLRGIKVDDAGTGALIEDCDFYFTRGANPIRLHYRGEGGSGTIRNVRIYNDGDSDAIQEDWETDGNWSGEDIHLTGSGNLDVPDHFETVTGDSAAAPNTDYSVWTPVDGESSGGSETDAAPVGESDSEPAELRIQASPDNPDTNCDVTFTATGEIEYGDEAEPDTDRIVENDDGSYTATSVEMNPDALDSYLVSGTITAFSVTEGYEVSVTRDGEPVTIDELVDDQDRGDGDDTGPESLPNRIEVDGTGDAEESAYYDFSVTGDLTLDEGRTVVGNGETLWLTGDISEGTVSGHVRNGVDAFFYSGQLERIEIDGDADVNVYHG
ncbi:MULTISPECIES: hypothetical protein [Haloarcula]|uniref:hypothetical protein n=1 Tax=Haloarcula TaxID=2237 RepID=UPI0023E7A54E|nr:hypothetical protein [Halomicroarcula sp. SHR3]